jgi:hypothetical protein
VALLPLAACGSGAVDVRRSEMGAADRAACTALVKALPPTVADLERRRTEGNTLAAAWGDPAVVLRCGVGAPAEQGKFAGCQTVNGVDWFAPDSATTDQSSDVTLTTVGREPRVELFVPAEHRPPAAALVDVGPAVKAHSRSVRPCS